MLRPSWGPAHLRPGHLSTIVSPGEQSQVREGGSCHDPRPTDGGHGNPFSFSGKWAGPAQARGLHTEHCGRGSTRGPRQVRRGAWEAAPLRTALGNGITFGCPQGSLVRVSSIAPPHPPRTSRAAEWDELVPPLGDACNVTALWHLLSLLTRRSNGLGVQRLGLWTYSTLSSLSLSLRGLWQCLCSPDLSSSSSSPRKSVFPTLTAWGMRSALFLPWDPSVHPSQRPGFLNSRVLLGFKTLGISGSRNLRFQGLRISWV